MNPRLPNGFSGSGPQTPMRWRSPSRGHMASMMMYQNKEPPPPPQRQGHSFDTKGKPSRAGIRQSAVSIAQ
eukprot:5303975-Amphidinium_carterae.2